MQILLAVLSILLIVAVFLSRLRNDYWIFKVLEYPRIQKLFLTLIVTGCWIFFWPVEKLIYQIILAGISLSVIYLVYKIWPYTILAKKEMLKVDSTDMENELKIFTANVFQDNQQYERLLKQITTSDPDLILLIETNAAWADAMKDLKKDYPYTVLAPQENTYGLLFYSRLKLENAKVMYLVKKDLPSIEAIVILASGQQVQLWGLHPEPPVPGESQYSTAKDKELMKVALKVKDAKLPCIVFGDLNDVAWSYTTELFQKVSETLDPRRGRGFFNTFSAHNWFIRFPLDYIFCSKEFSLISMQRMPKNGSDHFAMMTHFAFKKDTKKKQDPPKADNDEMEAAHELAGQPVKE